MRLNIYLHNNSAKDYTDCLDADAHPIQRPSTDGYRIYHTVNENQEGPPWVQAIKHVIDPAIVGTLTNRQCGLTIVFKLKTGRGPLFFSACFGVGHTLLRKKTVEPNFGLLTTLNSIKTLRQCSSRLLGTQTRQKSVLTNYDARVRELGFDFDEEILALASGKCGRNDLGTTISGADSLKLSSRIGFEQIPGKLADIYQRYQEKTYRKNGFDFIDQIEILRDEDLIDDLNTQLLERFNTPGPLPIDAMAPIDANAEAVCDYKISGLGRTLWLPEVTLEELRGYCDGKIDEEALHDTIRVQGHDASGESTTIKAPLFSYLTCQIELDGQTYVLANRRWYRVEADFLKRVKGSLQKGLDPYRGPELREWTRVMVKGKPIHDEGRYNAAYGGDRDFLVLDKKKFTSKGYGRGNSIEVADLFHLPTRSLICVKKNTRSSTLSHLFSQASVSAELFEEVQNYAVDFVDQVRRKWPRDRSVTLENLKELTFVYAIGSGHPPAKPTIADGVLALPVFSRVNMRKHVRAIRSLGHNVTLTYVHML